MASPDKTADMLKTSIKSCLKAGCSKEDILQAALSGIFAGDNPDDDEDEFLRAEAARALRPPVIEQKATEDQGVEQEVEQEATAAPADKPIPKKQTKAQKLRTSINDIASGWQWDD